MRRIYALSLRDLWYTAMAFSPLCFLLVFVEKRIKLRKELQTEFGLEDEYKDQDKDEEVAA